MRVSIHQPDYLPWLAYFDKMKRTDVFVFLDCAQYTKNKFQNRNKIKTGQGWTYLTIPISRDQYFRKIVEITLPEDRSWQRKHWKSISVSYSRAPYFKDYKDFFEKIYQSEHQFLADFNIEIIKYLKDQFSFQNQFVRESELEIDKELKGPGKLLAILKELKADYYLSGPSGKKYLDLSLFEQAGIEVEFQNYQHPEYPQLFGEFIPGLSAIDLLFNCGSEAGEKI
jgi:hypothetical protein